MMEDFVVIKKRRRCRVAVDPCLGFYVSQEDHRHSRLNEPSSDDRYTFTITSSSTADADQVSAPDFSAEKFSTITVSVDTLPKTPSPPPADDDVHEVVTVESFLQKLSSGPRPRPPKIYGRKSRRHVRSSPSCNGEPSSPIQSSEHDQLLPSGDALLDTPLTKGTQKNNFNASRRTGKSQKRSSERARRSVKSFTRRLSRAAKLSHVDIATDDSDSNHVPGLKFTSMQNLADSPCIAAHKKRIYVFPGSRIDPVISSFYEAPKSTATPCKELSFSLLKQTPARPCIDSLTPDMKSRSLSKVSRQRRKMDRPTSGPPSADRIPLKFVSPNEHEMSKQKKFGLSAKRGRPCRVVETPVGEERPHTPPAVDTDDTGGNRSLKRVKFSSPVNDVQPELVEHLFSVAHVASKPYKDGQNSSISQEISTATVANMKPELTSANTPPTESQMPQDKPMRRLSTFFSDFMENARGVVMSQSAATSSNASAFDVPTTNSFSSPMKRSRRQSSMRRQASFKVHAEILKRNVSMSLGKTRLSSFIPKSYYKSSSKIGLTRTLSTVSALPLPAPVPSSYLKTRDNSKPTRYASLCSTIPHIEKAIISPKSLRKDESRRAFNPQTDQRTSTSFAQNTFSNTNVGNEPDIDILATLQHRSHGGKIVLSDSFSPSSLRTSHRYSQPQSESLQISSSSNNTFRRTKHGDRILVPASDEIEFSSSVSNDILQNDFDPNVDLFCGFSDTVL